MTSSVPGPLVAGAVFAFAVFALIDAGVMCNREQDHRNHANVLLFVPTVLSLVGFVLFGLTTPRLCVDETNVRERVFFLAAWIIAMLSTIISLALVSTAGFVGQTTREYISPGVLLVGHTCLIQVSALWLWSSRGEPPTSDDLQW